MYLVMSIRLCIRLFIGLCIKFCIGLCIELCILNLILMDVLRPPFCTLTLGESWLNWVDEDD